MKNKFCPRWDSNQQPPAFAASVLPLDHEGLTVENKQHRGSRAVATIGAWGAVPPTNRFAPPHNIWEIRWYFYDDSVPKFKNYFVKFRGLLNPILFINKSIIIYLKLTKFNLALPQT